VISAPGRLIEVGLVILMLCTPVSISGSQVGLGLAVLGGIWESARRRTLIRTPLDGPILALLSVSLLSALLSEDPASSAKKLAGSWSILTLYLAAGWYGAPENLARILRWFLPTAVVFGAYGVIQHFTGWNAFRAGAGALHTLELAGRTVYFPRGGFSHYQTYANVFFMLFCLAGALALGSTGRPRIVRGAIAVLLGIVVFMTFTRGIWLSLVAALAIFTWIYARRAAPAIIGIGAAAVLLVLFVPSSLRSRVLSMSDTGVNVERLLAVRPRGALLNDGGRARDASGVSGLAALDEVGVAAACVDAMSARIGDPASTYAEGVVSAVNETARRLGVAVGQPAADAARRMLLGGT